MLKSLEIVMSFKSILLLNQPMYVQCTLKDYIVYSRWKISRILRGECVHDVSFRRVFAAFVTWRHMACTKKSLYIIHIFRFAKKGTSQFPFFITYRCGFVPTYNVVLRYHSSTIHVSFFRVYCVCSVLLSVCCAMHSIIISDTPHRHLVL